MDCKVDECCGTRFHGAPHHDSRRGPPLGPCPPKPQASPPPGCSAYILAAPSGLPFSLHTVFFLPPCPCTRMLSLDLSVLCWLPPIQKQLRGHLLWTLTNPLTGSVDSLFLDAPGIWSFPRPWLSTLLDCGSPEGGPSSAALSLAESRRPVSPLPSSLSFLMHKMGRKRALY